MTYSSNVEMNAFRNYIVEIASVEGNPIEVEKALQKAKRNITSEKCSKILSDYHEKRFSKKLFGNLTYNSTNNLVDALREFYKVGYSQNLNHDFVNRIIAEKSFTDYLRKIEAPNLLSGSTLYMSEFAAEESKVLTNKIKIQEKEITELKTDKEDLNRKVSTLSLKFKNLVSNIKNTLSVSDKAVVEYSNKTYEELNPEVSASKIEGAKYLGSIKTSSIDSENYPDGTSEKTTFHYHFYGKDVDQYFVKSQVEIIEFDGRMFHDEKIQERNRNQIQNLIINTVSDDGQNVAKIEDLGNNKIASEAKLLLNRIDHFEIKAIEGKKKQYSNKIS